jgi:hypothetical protein
MTSKNPVIAVRLDPSTFEKMRQLAERDGRSLANFAEFHLRRMLAFNLQPLLPDSHYDDPKSTPKKVPVQVDIADAIAATVKRGPVNTVSNNTSAMTHGDLKRAGHRKNLAARAARLAARVAKHK